MNGKGRPKKATGKRTRKIDARFTEEEYAVIVELEITLGIRKSDLVRSRVLKDAGKTIINAKELIITLNVIGAEMGRCGNNINQLAKYANILNKKAVLSPAVTRHFNQLFETYIQQQQLLESALRKVMRISGGKV